MTEFDQDLPADKNKALPKCTLIIVQEVQSTGDIITKVSGAVENHPNASLSPVSVLMILSDATRLILHNIALQQNKKAKDQTHLWTPEFFKGDMN